MTTTSKTPKQTFHNHVPFNVHGPKFNRLGTVKFFGQAPAGCDGIGDINTVREISGRYYYDVNFRSMPGQPSSDRLIAEDDLSAA